MKATGPASIRGDRLLLIAIVPVNHRTVVDAQPCRSASGALRVAPLLTPELKLTRAEEVAGFTAQGAAELGKRPERHVLVGVLEPGQGGPTDAEETSHFGLG